MPGAATNQSKTDHVRSCGPPCPSFTRKADLTMIETRPRLLGQPVVRLGAVTSTMDIARQLERLGAPEGTTVVAASQTHGRGRVGRHWQSPPGVGLYCSILLRPEIEPARLLPLAVAVGLSVCDAVDLDRAAGIQLKWPNDILAGDSKLGGILVSTSIQATVVHSAIVGIGLNLWPDPARPVGAVSLAEIHAIHPGLAAGLLPAILSNLADRYCSLCKGAPVEALNGWQSRLAYMNQRVTMREGDHVHTGFLRGIDSTGALVLESAAGRTSMYSGDVIRGPVPIT